MKLLFTGGGTGGHFYPIIAIVEEIKKIANEEKLVEPTLYYMSDSPYDRNVLIDNNLIFKQIPAGKLRRYFSIENFTDIFKTIFGIIKAFFVIFKIMPDVIFGKGGYGSFPALFVAKIFGIPVVIHESDSVPGKVNTWAGKFAKRIAISYPEAVSYFPEKRTALIGNPVRKGIMKTEREGARQFLNFEKEIPVVLILGGSQGSQIINQTILDILPKLVEKFQIIHQAGEFNLEEVKKLSESLLKNNQFKNRYRPFDYLNDEAIRMSAGSADIVVSRAGASAISEIASWGLPSVIIPISDSNGDHQRKNAFDYAKSGSAVVIEEKNLTGSVLFFQLEKLLENKEKLSQMSESAKSFAKPDSAYKIAKEILNIALTHER
jgi:UDP-N-acetylglucosamine--N-acetylmuramyl-(pentapeptide) pyrophosphoryl-undecaprenol N-acetylglucosamine transferase